MNSKISVIMPVYNAEKFIKDSIESILNQTYKNFEFIIVNDGSIDSSLKIIKEYKEKDNRIKIIDQKNEGVSRSRNNAIKKSTGIYIAFIDADDVWENNKIERQIQEFKKDEKLKICGTKAKIINEDNTETGEVFDYPPLENKKIKYSSIYKNPFITSSIMIKKDILNTNNLFNKKMNFCEDYEFITKYIYKNKSKNIDEYLIKYRIHKNSSSRKTFLRKIKMKIIAMKVRIISLFRLIKSIF